MPKPGRRGNTRHILIITVSITVAAVLTVMALFAKSSQGYAVLLGYAILIISAVLANHMIATSASDMRRMALLVLSVGILILFLGSLALIPFAPETTEETAPSPAVEAADENLTMGGHDRAFITLSSSDTAASVHGEEEGTAEPISSARTSRAVIWGIALPLLTAAIAGTAAAAFDLSDIVRYLLLAFTTGLLLFMLGGIVYILFTPERRIVAAAVEIPIAGESSEEEMIIAEEPAEAIPENETQPSVPSAPHVFSLVTEVSEDAASSSPAELPVITEETEEPEQIPSSAEIDEESLPAIPSAPSMFSLITAIDEGEPLAVPVVISKTDETVIEPSIDMADVAEQSIGTPVSSIDEEPVSSGPAEYYEAPRFEDDDFWSTFYIAGEDELEFEDGLYYFGLIVNDVYFGEIEALVEKQEPALNSADLRQYLSGELTDDAFNRIFVDGTSYISLLRFEELGVKTSFSSAEYEIRLDFTSTDMPVRIISMRNNIRRIARRPIGDGIYLEPAVFTLTSRYSLYTWFDFDEWDVFRNSLRFSFNSYNEARLYDVYFNFDYSFDFTPYSFNFDFGGYEFYTDFPESSMRLTWGNISTDLLSSRGTAVGIRFDKSPIYSDSVEEKSNIIDEALIIDKESDVQVFNDGREIYRETLKPGLYRLEDFTLYSGVNHIMIRVTPLDGSPYYEKEIDIIYSNSLKGQGDVDFGAAASIGRTSQEKDYSTVPGQVRIPLLSSSMVYDFRNVTLSGYLTAGLTDTLTLDTTIAAQNNPSDESAWRPELRLAMEMTHANLIGTTRYNFNVTERSDEFGKLRMPGFYARIGHQVSTGWTWLNSFNVALAYLSPMELNIADRHRFVISSGIAGRLGIMGYSLNYSGTINTDSLDKFNWNLGASMSFSFSRNIYLSASLNINTENLDIGLSDVSGRVAMTFYFNSGNVSMQTSGQDLSISSTIRNNRHSFRADADLNQVVDPSTYSFGLDYNYSGRYINAGVNLDAYNLFNSASGMISLSTSSIFADGLLAFNSYIPSNYMLIHQEDALKGNTLSIGSANNYVAAEVDTFFNTGLYSGVSSVGDSSFVIYSTDEDSFSGGQSFEFNLPYSNRKGFAVRISAEDRYAASGVVMLPDGSIWANGSSPLYSVSLSEENMMLNATESYIFSDSDGRFVITDLASGTYAFDVPVDDSWILYVFTVDGENLGDADITVFGTSEAIVDMNIPEPYGEAYMLTDSVPMSSNAFWLMLYPEMAKEAV